MVRGLDAPRVHIVERAYQLARTGDYRTLQEMVRVLEREGYREIGLHLGGRAIKKKLRELRDTARGLDAAC